jgi:hypothetical protein
MDLQSKLAQAIAAAAEKPQGELMSGFRSKHVGGGDFNEQNTGLGYRSPEGWMLGAYRNSINKPSVYAGREFSTTLFGEGGDHHLDAGVMLGGVTGYGRPVTPAILPELIYRMPQGRALAATVVPPIKGVTPATFALQMRKAF